MSMFALTLLPTGAVRVVVFFFSSRRRHTRSDRDWSSDVCSSDLEAGSPRMDRMSSDSPPPPGGSLPPPPPPPPGEGGEQPLPERGLGDILSSAFDIYGKNASRLLMIVAVIVVPLSVVNFLLVKVALAAKKHSEVLFGRKVTVVE